MDEMLDITNATRHAIKAQAPLGGRRSFIRRNDEVVEVWVLRISYERRVTIVTDGDAVLNIDPGHLVPGTL